jgi:hypothetical protein
VKRPTGITILAILAIIGGILSFLGALALIAAGALVAGGTLVANGTTYPASAGGPLIVLGVIFLVLGVLDIVVGIGFFRLSPWAWMLGIILQGAGLVLAIAEIALKYATLNGEILGMIISAGILVYLLTPGVRQAFGRA